MLDSQNKRRKAVNFLEGVTAPYRCFNISTIYFTRSTDVYIKTVPDIFCCDVERKSSLVPFFQAGKEEAEGPGDRVLHRRCQGVFQHRQLQLPHGHHL